MLKFLFSLFSLFLLYPYCFSQPTFSKIVDFGFPSQLFASVEVDSNFIYCNGSVLDSVISYPSRGLIAKYNLSGDLISFNSIGNADIDLFYFDQNLRWTRNNRIKFAGYSILDKVQLGIISEFDTSGAFINSSFEFNLTSVPYSLNKIHNWLDYGKYNDIVIGTYIQNSPDRLRIALLSRFLGIVDNEAIISHPYNIKNSSVMKLNEAEFILGNDIFGTTIGDGIRRCNLIQVDTFLNWNLLWESSSDSVWTGINDLIPCPNDGFIACFSRGKYYKNESTYRFVPSVVKFDKNMVSIDWITDIPGFSLNSENRSYNLENGFDSNSFYVCGMGHQIDNPPIGFSYVGFLSNISYGGNVNWTRRYTLIDTKSDYHYLYDIKKTVDGGLVLVGQIVDFEFGAPSPIQKAWILKVDSLGCLVPGCGLSSIIDRNIDKDALDIRLYPNPVSNGTSSLFIGMSSTCNYTLDIVDVSGNTVHRWNGFHTGPTTYILSFSDIVSGIYFIHLNINGKLWKETVVVN